MYVYVAGPYTKVDTIINIQQAIAAGDKLRDLGFTPFIPHMTYAWHMLYPHTIEYWYHYDLEWLEKCDALLRLPGESEGADKEVKYARLICNIPVFFSINDLVESMRKK